MKDNDHIDTLVAEWKTNRPDLDFDAIGTLLRIIRLGDILERELAVTARSHDLKPGQFQVLAAIRRKEPQRLTPSELNHVALLTSGAMTPLLDRLEEKKYLKRLPDPSDRRGVLVEITPRGRAVIDNALDQRIGRLNELSEVLGKHDRLASSNALRKLLVMLEGPDAG